jgi:hypothetical protein
MAAFVRSHLLDLFLSPQITSQYHPSRRAFRPTRRAILRLCSTAHPWYRATAQCNLECPRTCPGLVQALTRSCPELRSLRWRKVPLRPSQMDPHRRGHPKINQWHPSPRQFETERTRFLRLLTAQDRFLMSQMKLKLCCPVQPSPLNLREAHSRLLSHRHLFLFPGRSSSRQTRLPSSTHAPVLRLEPAARLGEVITWTTGSLVWIAPQKLRS